jgi:hypothetical protein
MVASNWVTVIAAASTRPIGAFGAVMSAMGPTRSETALNTRTGNFCRRIGKMCAQGTALSARPISTQLNFKGFIARTAGMILASSGTQKRRAAEWESEVQAPWRRQEVPIDDGHQ